MLVNKNYCDENICIALRELGYNYPQRLIPDYFGVFEEPQYDERIHLYDAQQWLREKKKLFVEVTLGAFDQTYLWEICNTENSNLITGGFSSFDSYEEALSEGIKESIKILKEKELCGQMQQMQ